MPPKARKRPAKRDKDEKGWQKKQKRKVCIFCKDKIEFVDYKDAVLLRKFISDRGKIRSRRLVAPSSCTRPRVDGFQSPVMKTFIFHTPRVLTNPAR